MKNEIVCKHCGNVFFKKAKSCPNCGTKHKKPIWKRVWVWVLIVLVVIGVGFGGGEDTPTEPVDNTFEINEVVETDDFKMVSTDFEEFTDYGYFPPTDGYKVIRAYYSFENISDTDQYISSTELACYVDGKLCNSYDYKWTESDTLPLGDTVSSGRTVEGWVYFEVPKDADDVEIEFGIPYINVDKIIFEY